LRGRLGTDTIHFGFAAKYQQRQAGPARTKIVRTGPFSLAPLKELRARVPVSEAPLRLPKGPSVQEKVAHFKSLFRGREDVFPRLWENPRKGTKGIRHPRHGRSPEAKRPLRPGSSPV